MKARINSVNVINNASINVTADIMKDDGTLIVTRTFGIVNTSSSSLECLLYLKQSLLNIGNQVITENNSKMNSETQTLIGNTIQL